MSQINEYGYKQKTHGYLVFPRHSILLLQEIGFDLFGFYAGLVMSAFWHRGNKNFGRVMMSQAEIAEKFHKTQSTISRLLTKLEEYKYFIIRHPKQKHVFLGYFPLFLTDVAIEMRYKDYANLHELYADMYKINASLQGKNANVQGVGSRKAPQRHYSSSNDNSFSEEFDREEIDIDAIDIGIETMKRE